MRKLVSWLGAALLVLSWACGGDEPTKSPGTSGSGAGSGVFMPLAGIGASGAGAGGAGTTAGTAAVVDAGTDAGPVGPGTCALTMARVRVTEVNVGTSVVNDEDEAALHPIVISALASGGSRIAFMGSDAKLHIATLDQADKLFGTPFTLEAKDFADMYADEAGGVVLAARAAAGSGDKHCGTLTNLCGNAASLPAEQECWDMYLVRFNGPAEKWATKLTESSVEHPPYLNSPTDAQNVIYLWQAYAHHGRIAFDGSRYAGYFGAAVSVSQACVQPDTTLATAVNIHQGDRMSVVDKDGALLPAAGGFDWGCSHSGYERVLWDPVASRFVTVCKTDNQNRIALAPSYSTIESVDLAATNLGDLVTRVGGGYWLASSDAEAAGSGNADVKLLGFSIASDAATLEDEVPVAAEAGLNERAPHLAAYGEGGLLVAWESASSPDDLKRSDTTRSLHVQARDRATGAAAGDALLISGVQGNRYHELRAFPDGSAAFVAPGATASSVKVLRILPCAQ